MTNFFKQPPAPKKKRKRMKTVSEKRKAVNAQRRTFVEEQLAKREKCEAGPSIFSLLMREKSVSGIESERFGCTLKSTDMHEPLTRARAPGAETIIDEGNSVALCRWCHDWIHRNPSTSERIGLLRSSRGL